MIQNITDFNSTFLPSTILSFDGKRCQLSVTWENVLYSVFMVLILIGSIVGNSIVSIVFVLSKQLRSRLTSYFIISLACSDMLFASFNIPMFVGTKLYSNEFCFHPTACFIFIISDAVFNVASILALFLIGMDRYIAIVMPFQYTSLLNRKRVMIMLAFVWVFSIIWAIGGIIDWDGFSTISVNSSSNCSNKNPKFYVASYFGLYLVPLIILTFTYLRILKVAITHIKAIEATQVDFRPNHLNNSKSSGKNSEGEKSSRKRQRRKELKATKSVAVVYLAFLICWFPSLVINFIILLNHTYFPTLRKTNKILFDFLFYTFVHILPVLNTMVNPIIYNFFNKPFKKTLMQLFKRARRREYSHRRRQSRIQSLEGGVSLDSTTLSSYINRSISNDQLKYYADNN